MCSPEYIVQRLVREFGDRGDAKAVCCQSCSCVGTKGTTERDLVRSIQIATAHKLDAHIAINPSGRHRIDAPDPEQQSW